jgi:hypothetical protein
MIRNRSARVKTRNAVAAVIFSRTRSSRNGTTSAGRRR